MAVRGLLRLARFDPDFMRYFDLSARGALRSFWLALPLYVYYLWAAWPIAEPMPPSLAQYFAAMTVGYLHLWILAPLVVIWIAPFLEREEAAPGCIAVYNWSSLLVIPLFVPLLLLSDAGIDPQILVIPTYAVRLLSIAWEAFILMHTLRLPLWQSALASIADFFISQWLILPIFYTIGMGA